MTRLHDDPTLDRVERSIDIAAAPERVWHLLTDEESLRRWYAFGGASVELCVGGRLTFRWAEHGLFVARVLEVDAPRRLSFRQAHEPDSEPTPDNCSTVTFTITATESGCRLTVVESGLAALDEVRVGTGFRDVQEQGWSAAFTLFADLVRDLGSGR